MMKLTTTGLFSVAALALAVAPAHADGVRLTKSDAGKSASADFGKAGSDLGKTAKPNADGNAAKTTEVSKAKSDGLRTASVRGR